MVLKTRHLMGSLSVFRIGGSPRSPKDSWQLSSVPKASKLKCGSLKTLDSPREMTALLRNLGDPPV